MASPILAGMGNALSQVTPTIEDIRTNNVRRQAMAMEMALRQQEIAQRQQQMDLEKQKFQATLPTIQSEPQRFAFEQTTRANPDWMGTQSAVDLARQLGVGVPTATTPSDVIGNVKPEMQGSQVNKMPSVSDAYQQAGVYPETNIPIPEERQAKTMQDKLAIGKGQTELDVLRNPGKFLDNLLGTPQGQPQTPNGIGALPPIANRVEGQTYLAPGNMTVQWVKAPSGQFALKQVPKANPNPLASPDARTRIGLDVFGKVSGLGIKSSDVLPPAGQTREDKMNEVVDKKNAEAMFPPATIQRGLLALQSASGETDRAISELERLYPGITKAAQLADNLKQAPSFMQYLTGHTVPYGDALSQGKITNERLKYALGMPTPLANAIQLASFANLEQMSGQLPGIRGFQQLLPLFKQHQSAIGFETPVQTVQRLMHMKGIMNQTADEMKTPIQMTPQVQQ